MPQQLNTDSSQTPEGRAARKRYVRTVTSLIILFLLIGAICGFTTNFIPSKSMEPLLVPGDHILTMRAWMAFPAGMGIGRNDVIVFRIPLSQLGEEGENEAGQKAATEKGKPPETILIKRIIGLPGERIRIEGNSIFINGAPYKADYTYKPVTHPDDLEFRYGYLEDFKIPKDEYFVLGDNRDESEDSRYWGTVKRQNILGRFVKVLYNEGQNGPNALRTDSK